MPRLIHYWKDIDELGNIEERVVWQVPESSKHPDAVKYRLAYVKPGSDTPLVLYDNHHPKGHHKHILGRETLYQFRGLEKLLDDFGRDVEAFK